MTKYMTLYKIKLGKRNMPENTKNLEKKKQVEP